MEYNKTWEAYITDHAALVVQPDGRIIATVVRNFGAEEAAENARILAAAPDMAKAIETALDIIKGARTPTEAQFAIPLLQEAYFGATGKNP